MCTRYLFTDPAEAIRDLFRITAPLPNWPPNYNVAPTHIMPVIRPIDGGRELAMMEWGLVPFFTKDGKRSFTTFNARGEELRSKPMYREPLKTRRCVVPATGCIEFNGPKGDKTAHLSRAWMVSRSRWRVFGTAGKARMRRAERDLYRRHHRAQ